mgnify:FL=1
MIRRKADSKRRNCKGRICGTTGQTERRARQGKKAYWLENSVSSGLCHKYIRPKYVLFRKYRYFCSKETAVSEMTVSEY